MKRKLLIGTIVCLSVTISLFAFTSAVNYAFWSACSSQNVKAIQTTVALGANIESQDMGRTALIFAVEANEVETVKALLELGANPNAKSKEGVTPLEIAEGEKFSTVEKILRNFGAKS